MKLQKKNLQTLLAAGIFTLLMMLLLLIGNASRESSMTKAYLWPLAVTLTAATGLFLFRKPSLHGCIGVGLAVWFLICNAVNGDYYLVYNLRFLFGIWMTYALCLPLMSILDAGQLRRWLTAFLVGYGLYMALLSLLCCYAALARKAIMLPGMTNAIRVDDNRLYVLNKHPNEIACAMVIALFSWFCLAGQSRSKLLRLLCCIACVPITITIGLTVSRTSMAVAALAYGAAAMVLISGAWKGSRHVLPWLAAGVAFAVITAVVLWGLNAGVPRMMQASTKETLSRLTISTAYAEETAGHNAANQIAQRSMLENFGTFSARTEIWRAGLQYVKDHPSTLFFGATDAKVSVIPRDYLGRNVHHLHNSWLEMLVQAGIPGLLAYGFIIVRVLWAALHQFFNTNLPSWQRLLSAAPVVLLVCTLMEIYPCVSGNVMDMMYMLLAGAVIQLDRERIAAKRQASE